VWNLAVVVLFYPKIRIEGTRLDFNSLLSQHLVSYHSSTAPSKASSTQRDLVLPLSISTNILFPEGRPVAAYIFLLSRLVPSIFPSSKCFRRQFLYKIWPIQLVFLRLLCVWYSSPPWLSVTLHFSIDRPKWSSPSFSTGFKCIGGKLMV